MTQAHRQTLSQVMKLMHQFINVNGFSQSEALKKAWQNVKLVKAMKKGIIHFWFVKVDGSTREAYGTLSESIVPTTGSERKANRTVQVYFDTEKQSWRSFKKANIRFN